MIDSRVARRYAGALFQAARAGEMVRAVETDLGAVVDALRSNPEFRHFTMTPLVGRDDKTTIFQNVFGDKVTSLTMQVLRLMIERGREADLESVHAEFVKLRRSEDGIVFATVTSREPLTPEQKVALVEKVELRIKKKIEPEFVTDVRVIGGVKVAYDNYVLDGTVRGSIGKLREKLRYELLKQS